MFMQFSRRFASTSAIRPDAAAQVTKVAAQQASLYE